MAGLAAETGRGGRRTLDSELNMVPMIDLLLVTISFLLLTAVWSRSARIESDAVVPGAAGAGVAAAEPRLHLDMTDPAKIVLRWSVGPTVLRTSEIARSAEPAMNAAHAVRFSELGSKLAAEWEAAGTHRAETDTSFDELVLHTRDDAPYAEIVGAMDAAYGVKRRCLGGAPCPAFRVVFASR
jgi:hypothetical protein